jgi:hypothetical protein
MLLRGKLPEIIQSQKGWDAGTKLERFFPILNSQKVYELRIGAEVSDAAAHLLVLDLN